MCESVLAFFVSVFVILEGYVRDFLWNQHHPVVNVMETTPGSTHGAKNQRQKRMGPAPFASFEDLSDEVRSRLESPEEKNFTGSVVRLPGIKEDITPTTPADAVTSPCYTAGISLIGAVPGKYLPNEIGVPHTGIVTLSAHPSASPMSVSYSPQPTKSTIRPPNTPRIDISRASSSSHHDSRDSTPEREIFDGQDTNGAKLGLGFKEDGALDLRSSTEELDFHDPEELRKTRYRTQTPSPVPDETCHFDHRKDSQCSDIVLLSISGRSSRISSIGSQGSAQSRLSNASHLSVISGQSGTSRCSSPHKTLLETSFCGSKLPTTTTLTATETSAPVRVDAEELEKVLLSRKHDPTQAVLAEGIKVDEGSKNPPAKPTRKVELSAVKNDVRIHVEKTDDVGRADNTTDSRPKLPPRKIVSKSGVEYIYIPLKGPLPVDDSETGDHNPAQAARSRTHQSASSTKPNRDLKGHSKSARSSKSTTKLVTAPRPASVSASTSPAVSQRSEPQYIRIKLKPDHCYDVDDQVKEDRTKPNSLDLSLNDESSVHVNTPSVSPKLSRYKIDNGRAAGSFTPSPSISRRSSFASLFKAKEATISPDSPTTTAHKRKNTFAGILKKPVEIRERSRSRSKSRERVSTAPSSTESIDTKGSKHKSVLSIFKSSKKGKDGDAGSQETLPSSEGIGKVEFKFNEKKSEKPLDGDSVRIPLHSPTYYEDRGVLQDWKTSSQDSQETVIEASTRKNVDVVVEPIPQDTTKGSGARQNSTSSENVTFSTQLGQQNEVFSTKLPKQKTLVKQPHTIELNGSVVNVPLPDLSVGEEPIKSEPVTLKEDVKPADDTKPEEVKRLSVLSAKSLNFDEDRNSSDSELDYPKLKKDLGLKLDLDPSETERKAIVLQQDSFEDELPYVPTTLPQERSAAMPIVPVKQRSTMEMRTCPIERPRSTTPINPSSLENYCEEVVAKENAEKLKISLPRNDSIHYKGGKSRASTEEIPPPPLPPKGVQKSWINFEEIPEKRKPPRRIQTIPSRGQIEVPDMVLQENVVYTYVNPEECKCECHELNAAKERDRRKPESQVGVREDELPLLEDDPTEDERNGSAGRMRVDADDVECRNLLSDAPADFSLEPRRKDTNVTDTCLGTPFTSDLGLASNRSSIVSQDDPQCPRSPNAFPKHT
ncbi:uncharacterized protein LOC132704552 isoform X2 [Cylas formicarius]|uniref:uncharacterized protein LOC132704552 isoform X2 n=1 Tax=Cylas formicarius TaxID=197179 RepID=UPI0029583ABA|nr:uncharacterized protein LOC132704552 isoform X2 [Cylas formicarius]